MCDFKSGNKILKMYILLVNEKQKLSKQELIELLKCSSRSISYYISTINCLLTDMYIFKEIVYNKDINKYEMQII